MSPGGFERSRITGRAFFLLESHNRRLNLGRVLTNEAGVVVRRHPDTVRGADVLFISFRRLPKSENW
ncbi:MAG TPA: Uma2 family endonuclease, partial [Vicinamibacteria bacterium]|nr:Uma2 family endonuclease [Vicinamibacteria bacterium]